jgi:hypothetical protein
MKKEEQRNDVIARNNILSQRETLIDYLKMKIEVEDWHAVCDAGMDLRELDVKLKVLDES